MAHYSLPRRSAFELNQSQPLQTRMAVLADDDVVVHGKAERARLSNADQVSLPVPSGSKSSSAR